MSRALKVLTLLGVMLACGAAMAADIEVSSVQGEASYAKPPKIDVERQSIKFGDREYPWKYLINIKLRPLQNRPGKGYKIFLRNGDLFYGDIVGASIEGTDLFLKIKSNFFGGEVRSVSINGIAGVQNLNLKVYMQRALATLQRKAKNAPFGRIDFHGKPMTAEELQELFDKQPDKFAAEGEKELARTSNDFARFMKDKKRWEYDFFYGIKGRETEAYGLIDRIDDNLNVVLVWETSKKEVSGNLKDIVGLGFKADEKPSGFGAEPYVKILGVRGEVVTGQITSEKDGVIEVKTDIAGITLKLSMDDIAEIIFFNGSFVFLSDLAEDGAKVKAVEYGDICMPGTTTSESFPWQRDRSTMEKRPPLKLNGKIYRKGIGVHSHSELTFQIGGAYKRFKALAGIHDDVPKPGNVTIEIYGDGKEMLKKTTVKSGDKPLAIDVDVTGVKELKIVVDFGEGGYHNDHCDLANAILVK
ncbi:MAG: hypothetical protein DRP79_03950 [Planctomycetota bacterium]|nr:MAG: hypothetical protein DRP79_03950 [Planctomycetota bacterium]